MLESLLQLYGMAMVLLPVVAFVSLRKRIRFEGIRRRSALARYAGTVILPVLVCAVVFVIARALESLTSMSLGAEGLRETFALAIALGVLVWLLGSSIFALGLMFMRLPSRQGASGQ